MKSMQNEYWRVMASKTDKEVNALKYTGGGYLNLSNLSFYFVYADSAACIHSRSRRGTEGQR